MTRENELGRSQLTFAPVLGKLALVALSVSALAACASGLPSTEEDFTRTYGRTYDEVFQASQEAVERMGLFVKTQDKDKGTITGEGTYTPKGYTGPSKFVFTINIKILNDKPETSATITAERKGGPLGREGGEARFRDEFLIELQKVLATYR
jgi:hypothetical protein